MSTLPTPGPLIKVKTAWFPSSFNFIERSTGTTSPYPQMFFRTQNCSYPLFSYPICSYPIFLSTHICSYPFFFVVCNQTISLGSLFGGNYNTLTSVFGHFRFSVKSARPVKYLSAHVQSDHNKMYLNIGSFKITSTAWATFVRNAWRQHDNKIDTNCIHLFRR
jgi:hypothetical protein